MENQNLHIDVKLLCVYIVKSTIQIKLNWIGLFHQDKKRCSSFKVTSEFSCLEVIIS